MWNADSIAQLKQAASDLDRQAVAAHLNDLTDHLIGRHPLSDPEAKTVLGVLRGMRRFDELQRVTETMLQVGLTNALIRRQNAQALIERGALLDALSALEALVADCDHDPVERAEARGLIGRVHKQRFVQLASESSPSRGVALNAALSAYLAAYLENPQEHTWHGINAIALLKRAQREGLEVRKKADPDQMARDILKQLDSKTGRDVWDFGTAAEACLALDDLAGAAGHLSNYLAKDSGADAFAVAGTLRQFREIWQFTEEGPGGGLLATLQAALLQRSGSVLQMAIGALPNSLAAAAHQKQSFERVFGASGPQTFLWYQKALSRASAVARVEHKASGRGIGTGFLIRARDFLPTSSTSQDGELLLLTNAHVLSNSARDALRPDDAQIRFEAVSSASTIELGSIVWESPVEELDACIVRLQTIPMDVEPVPLAPAEEPSIIPGSPRKLCAIGYPLGGSLALSLSDNLQLAWKHPRVHYLTPTERGCSGSPMFDDQWRVVALHHAGSTQMARLDGSGFYEANEGIWIHAIAAAARLSAPQLEASTTVTSPSFRSGVFVSYCHEDGKYLEELKGTLAPLHDELDLWDDRRIATGEKWFREIEMAIERARIAVLLVSDRFLASPFIMREEVPRILRSQEKRGLTVFWIPVTATLFDKTPLAALQSAHDPQRPIANMSRRADRIGAFVEIARKLAAASDLSRVSNSLRAADQAALQSSGLGDTVGPTSSVSHQRGDTISVLRGTHVAESITAADLERLDEGSRQLIRMHEASLTAAHKRWVRLYPKRMVGSPEARQKTLQELKEARSTLCVELNHILRFLQMMGKHLDDHYQHVRYICQQSPEQFGLS